MAAMNTGHSPIAYSIAGADSHFDDLLGFAIVSVVPAVFWMMILAGVGRLADWEIGTEIVACTGLGIAAFLSVIFGVLRMRAI